MDTVRRYSMEIDWRAYALLLSTPPD